MSARCENATGTASLSIIKAALRLTRALKHLASALWLEDTKRAAYVGAMTSLGVAIGLCLREGIVSFLSSTHKVLATFKLLR